MTKQTKNFIEAINLYCRTEFYELLKKLGEQLMSGEVSLRLEISHGKCYIETVLEEGEKDKAPYWMTDEACDED